MEAGKDRLARDMVREATRHEVQHLERENGELEHLVADMSLEGRRLKKTAIPMPHDVTGARGRALRSRWNCDKLRASGSTQSNTVADEGLLMPAHGMRFLIPMLVLMVGAITVAACGGSDEPELPGTNAASVVAYLEEVDYQKSWELWPGVGEKYQGSDPHGMLLTTYLNPAAFDALADKEGIMPKRGHHSQGELHHRGPASR